MAWNKVEKPCLQVQTFDGEIMRKTLESFAQEQQEDIVFFDGFDDAIVGIIKKFNSYSVLYDTNKVIQILMKDMSEEDAYEYFSYNIESAWLGENTPAFTCDIVNFFEG